MDDFQVWADARRKMDADIEAQARDEWERKRRASMQAMMFDMLATVDLGLAYATFNPNPGVYEIAVAHAERMRTIIADGFAKILAPAKQPEGVAE